MTDVLAVNIGSSSLKFALHTVVDAEHVDRAHVSGVIEGLEPGGSPELRLNADGDKSSEAIVVAPGEKNIDAALGRLKSGIKRVLGDRDLLAIAHRVVHGGMFYNEPVRVDPTVMANLESLNPLAPLHQPHNLSGIRACIAAFPDLPQVACFDTGFHRTISAFESHFGLPAAFHAQGVRRYGFHGLSYDFVAGRLGRLSSAARGRLLMAHLGNGASLCAAVNGKSVATSMGFSALDGLLMGTRSGAIDPGVLLYLMDQGWAPEKISRLLYKESGLLGVSGISADMRTLHENGSPEAQFAVDLFVYRIRREAGSLIAVMGGLDALAFTGGIGEHDAAVRASVCADLGYLGVKLDPAANQTADGSARMPVHAPDSTVEVWVLPTDEGRVAAESALAVLRDARANGRA